MRVDQAFRFALDPTPAQQRRLAGHAGAVRKAHNWGLALVSARLEVRARVREAALVEGATAREADAAAWAVAVPWSLPALRREWNRAKPVVAPWWAEYSKEAYNTGLANLADALGNWSHSKAGSRAGPRVGWPVFARRGRAPMSFRYSTGSFGLVDATHVRLPRIGVVHTLEPTAKLSALLDAGSARILSASVKCRAGRWTVSFGVTVEREVAVPARPETVVGVDVGIAHLAVIAGPGVEARFVANPKAAGRYARRIARLNGRQSRRQPGSARYRRNRLALTRAYGRVADIRGDAMSKLTTDLAKTYGTVVVEHLAVKNMVRRPKPRPDPARTGRHLANGSAAKAGLNRSIHDAALRELRRQLKYKTGWYGSRLVTAARNFPSSKLCSACGTVKATLPLSERVYLCDKPGCRLHHRGVDRDLNAALNLAALEAPDGTGSGPGTEEQKFLNARGDTQGVAHGVSANRETGSPDRHQTGTAAEQSTAA